MAGATASHVKITRNVLVFLANGLRGGPCEPYMTGMKVKVAAVRASYCPDVVATCDERSEARPR